MSTHVTMEDGSEAGLTEHLSQVHRKGVRGFTQEYLTRLHAILHQGTRSAAPEHSHPAAPEAGGTGEQAAEPATA